MENRDRPAGSRESEPSRAPRQLVDRIDALIARIGNRKARLDALRPLTALALARLKRLCDIGLTYTSDAIEGNALKLRERRRSGEAARVGGI